jgi:hypothetical protein
MNEINTEINKNEREEQSKEKKKRYRLGTRGGR